MKKALTHLLLFVAVTVCGLLAVGCSTLNAPTAQTATAAPAAPESVAATAKVKALALTIDRQCRIGLPFMQSLLTLQTDPGAVALVTKTQADAMKVCAVAATLANPPFGVTVLPTLDLAAINGFAAQRVPDLLLLVKNSKLDDRDKTAASLAITGAQLVLLQATTQ